MEVKVKEQNDLEKPNLHLNEKFNIKFILICKLFEKMIGNKNKMKHYLFYNILEW